MGPQVRQIAPATMLLASITYLATTVRQFGGPGFATIEADTNYGRVAGLKKISRVGRGFYEFRGIPYGRPPVGDLRFEPPQPVEPWDGVLNVKMHGATCLQYEYLTGILQGDEPCLYLNVATPKVLSFKKAREGTEELFPVIVFFHGGAFMSGFSNVYSGNYFLDENVILVTVNYRLGLFGFLNTGDDVVRGNMGLKDQSLALKWINENIIYFGGDPNRVTISGQSAGGASANFHMFSQLSKGLFHRVIAQSGNAFTPFAFNDRPRAQAIRLGKMMNCPTNNTREMVDCLKKTPALELNRANKEYLDLLADPAAFYAPTKEFVNDSNTFLADKPINLIRQGNVNHVPFIVGSNSNEALLFAIQIMQNANSLRRVNEEWEKYAPQVFKYDCHPNKHEISKAIRRFYIGHENATFTWSKLNQMSTAISDRYFLEGVHDCVRLHTRAGSHVFAYYYTYRGEFSFANILLHMTSFLPRSLGLFYSVTRNWLSKNLFRIPANTGIGTLDGSHLDEIPIFFHLPVISNEIIPGSTDYPMSSAMIQLWTSFAKNGKPDNFLGVEWLPISKNVTKDPHSVRFLKIDEKPLMIPEPFESRIKFWKSLKLNGKECHDIN